MQECGGQTVETIRDDLDPARLFGDISVASHLAEPKMGPTMVKKAAGGMKNLPTNMTCTLVIYILINRKMAEANGSRTHLRRLHAPH